MSRRRWMLGSTLGLAVLLALASLTADDLLGDRKIAAARDEFALLQALRRGALEEYFSTVRAEIKFWSLNEEVRRGLADLEAGWKKLGDSAGAKLRALYITDNPYPLGWRRQLERALDDSDYSSAHATLHDTARRLVGERGYYDFFLIDPQGNVIYTVEKEADYATNLNSGAFRETGLAEAYRRAVDASVRGSVVLTDMERYAPSADAPAMFAAAAILSRRSEVLGVLAMQVPIDPIRDIMQFTGGMGRTGETYLVGEDLLMRSDSRFSHESTILRVQVDTDTAVRALKGEQGAKFTDDYRGIEVLSAYGPMELDGFRWAVMAEIDRAEVIESHIGLRGQIGWASLFAFLLGLWSLWYLRPGTGSGESAFDLIDPGSAVVDTSF